MRYKTSIMTRSGFEFDLIDPAKNRFSVDDIAHALANVCRYCGHVREFFSVAQHSVMVSQLVPQQYAMMGLLHDASEAFIGDVAKPLKELLPDYKQVEARIEEFVLSRFGIDAHAMPPDIKRADMIALLTEQRDLMHGPDPEIMERFSVEPLVETIVPLQPKEAKELFLDRYREIRYEQDRAERLAHGSRRPAGGRRAAIYDPEEMDRIALLAAGHPSNDEAGAKA